ncbi:MgtC/SapB family protein [Bowmanella dokdonensis]|uniref:Protein MgtC n=1 Tax=Bowmanella dokdonensis TaxID=751969 RepID=A0A939IRS3_9ALTE|nr:MgtC/SapB family protein [Bowmanella dokdonensis]MBN7825796.1 MgtC/SapB family protein [Bowmanella dokdonensis]
MFELQGDNLDMLIRLVVALAAGAIIGYERSYHGRQAGFRTHALVCTASCVLMLVTVYQDHWISLPKEVMVLDPTRMAQGLMTGIGFLGAGVILREGHTIRGLTTAASIWITAAIGVLAGVGFYFPLLVSVILTLGVLSVFHWIEVHMPTRSFYRFDVQFTRPGQLTEQDIKKLLHEHGFRINEFSYRVDAQSKVRRHTMELSTSSGKNATRLCDTLEKNDLVLEFRLTPSD